MFNKIRKAWQTLNAPSDWPDDRYCAVCDGRIWWWQKATRLYSLGMTRAHLKCAAAYVRSALETRNISLQQASGMEKQVRNAGTASPNHGKRKRTLPALPD